MAIKGINVSRVKWKGLPAVLNRLNLEVNKIEGRTQKGLTKFGYLVIGDATKFAPRDVGNLKNSSFLVSKRSQIGLRSTKRFKTGTKARAKVAAEHSKVINDAAMKVRGFRRGPAVIIGFSAFYAVFVHENLEARHTEGMAKFLEYAAAMDRMKGLGIVQREARIR